MTGGPTSWGIQWQLPAEELSCHSSFGQSEVREEGYVGALPDSGNNVTGKHNAAGANLPCR